MSRGASVIVAGAGALGLSCALALADAGCSVTLCDPLDAPQASAVAAGMLAPVFEVVLDGGGEADLALLLSARNLWPALAASSGVILDRAGTAAVGPEAWLAEVRARLLGFGLRGVELPRTMLDEMTPGVAPGLRALLVREDWRLEPRAALAALRAAAQAAGVQFRAETVRERGAADWLVAATGAARDLAPELSRLAPIKGQILRYPGVRGGAVSLRSEGAYAVPGEGGLALGATMEAGRADTAVDRTSAAPLVRAGEALLPGLAGAAFEISAGVRAATPDGLPLVGPSREPGVIVAAGARRNGWLLAPLVAQVVTAHVTGRDPGPYAARLDPARFAAGETA
ncbi:FAD-dependent oxidoreductase [Phenylobacterium sp.]|uniref:NAD(P)/FAD-dependent oxidoreductase n=1 Tax=Phenylobacterium sp. TaxID=1871053 RepID=UPI001214001F|nr:FAD-dependent oxidoreductase [Phenylobacterium sp.]THD57573.1 MAG: FAD-dependent oxidoreductase [Phenylobacterium sp.]